MEQAQIRKEIQNTIDDPIPFGIYNPQIRTGMNHFPYSQNFRGKYDSPIPVIFGRQAGFCPRIYPYKNPIIESVDSFCLYQAPCSTIFPDGQTKWEDHPVYISP